MKIGNIVAKQTLDSYNGFNIYENYEDVDNELPTLIVGLKPVKKIIPDFDILNRVIDNKTSWTFTLKEKRDYHNEDLVKFKDFCYGYLIKDVTYLYIDPFNYKLRGIKKIIKRIRNTDKLISFHYNNMVYLLSDKIIFGINLDVLEFLEININRLLDKIKRISHVFLDDKEILIEYINHMEHFNDEVKYVPLLYSINNES